MKRNVQTLLSLLLSLSLTLSLCAPAALAAESSDSADLSALAVCEETMSAAPESSAAACESQPNDEAADTGADPSADSSSQPESEGVNTDTNPAQPDAEVSKDADISAQQDHADAQPDSTAANSAQADGADAASSADNSAQPDGEDAGADLSADSTDPRQEPARRVRVRSAEQLSDFLADQWNGDYFREAVVDTKRDRVTVDGERVSVTDAFGADADRKAIFDSPEAAEAWFEETSYEAESCGGGKVVVTAPYQTCRLVVTAKSLDGDYGAETVVEYPDYHQFVLQFPDEETTQAAFESLSQEYPCYVDELLWEDECLQDAETETWGGTYMGTSTLKSAGTLSASGNAVVAIIDTGCWSENPFFEGRSFSDASRSFGDDDGPFVDVNGSYHGSHVAGILHTCTPANVELMILRIWTRRGGSITSSMLLADTALKYALENGADVINFSMGAQGTTPSQEYALDETLHMSRDMGVPVVCSAGNVSLNVDTNYPACSSDTIAVSAINRSGQFAYTYSDSPDESNLGTGFSGSSYGALVDFCAPGVNVYSASKTGITVKSGTSMAAPHITAALAWLRLEDPTADWEQLYTRLRSLCVDLGDTGKDDFYGWGCPDLSTLASSSGHTHHWTGAVTTPTCLTRGYTVYTCSGCNLVRMRDYTGPVHRFDESGVCTVCGQQLENRCGDDAVWSYSSATETLSITGSGTVTTASWENLYPQQFIRRVSLSGVTELSDGLFAGYSSLESVNLGIVLSTSDPYYAPTLVTLGARCFSGCTALKSIILPKTLTSIGAGALCGCTALERIDCRSADFTVKDKCLLYSSDMKRLLVCGGAWSGGTMTVPDTVSEIGADACQGVAGLTELRLSTSLETLGAGAFRNCANLGKIYARSSLTATSTDVFAGDTATVYVSEGCTGWENHAAFGSKLTWDSYPGDLSRWTMSLNSSTWSYTGNPRYPGIILTHGDTTLWNYKGTGHSTNYEAYFNYRYANNTELGLSTDGDKAPTATITGVGIYYGSQSLPFTISLSAPTMNPPVCVADGVQLSWSAVTGADWYQVLRRDGDGSTANLPGAVTADTVWTDTTAQSGHTYTYSVWCYTEAYKTAAQSERTRYRSRYQPDQPPILYLAALRLSSVQLVDGDKVELLWDAVDGAETFRVLRLNADGEWATVTEGLTQPQWTDSAPVPGQSNTYAVQAVAADGTASVLSPAVSVDCPAVPVLVSAANEGVGVRVKWQKQAGVKKYRVLCKSSSGSWKKVADTSSSSALVKTYDGKNALKTGKTYTFTVRGITADGKSYTTGGDEAGKSVLFVCAPTLSSLKNEKRQKLTVQWGKVSGAAGYQLQIALNNSFSSGKKTVNLKGAGAVKRSLSGLKKKKTWYVRIRSYKIVSGKKRWSTWSKVKKATIKK